VALSKGKWVSSLAARDGKIVTAQT